MPDRLGRRADDRSHPAQQPYSPGRTHITRRKVNGHDIGFESPSPQFQGLPHGRILKQKRQQAGPAAFSQGNDAQAWRKASAVMGRRRTRLPVKAATALAMAGAATAVPGSPMPPGFSVLLTKTMSICGASYMRTGS